MRLSAGCLRRYRRSIRRTPSFCRLVGSEVCAEEQADARIEFFQNKSIGIVMRAEGIAGVPGLQEVPGNLAVGQLPGSLTVKADIHAEGGIFDANGDQKEKVFRSGGDGQARCFRPRLDVSSYGFVRDLRAVRIDLQHDYRKRFVIRNLQT